MSGLEFEFTQEVSQEALNFCKIPLKLHFMARKVSKQPE